MSEHLRVSPRPIVVERTLRHREEDVAQRFLGDPADWLPGRITMRGASTFHARLRVLGAMQEVQYLVGTPWTRGSTVTRRLRVQFPDPPLGMAWVMPVVDGELTVDGRPPRRVGFEGAPVSRGMLDTHRLAAARVMQLLTAGVADRLASPYARVAPTRRARRWKAP